MKNIDLRTIADALDGTFDGWQQYLNRETGEVESLPEDSNFYDGDSYEEDIERLNDPELFARLPDQNEIHEYRIMEDFAKRSGKAELITALHQKHPYRKFKDALIRLDIDDLYYAFRGDAYYLIASEWCRKNGISYRDRRKPEEKLTDSIFSDERLSNRALEGSIKPGRYRHYKGNEYEVLCLAKHSETEELMVVYKALYGEGQVWVRPASMWNETVVKNGQEIKRFTFLGTTN